MRWRIWKEMKAEPVYADVFVLLREREVPVKAYYVLRGFVLLYGYLEGRGEYVCRIYGPGSMVVLDCFMYRQPSVYMVKSAKYAVLRSISFKTLERLYVTIPGMPDFALQAAASAVSYENRIREQLLALPVVDRVVQFYKLFTGLLPARTSPLPDDAIAYFLAISKYQLRRARGKLMR
ncbi:MAG: cyclic nucleotide-binding domain-containing protein [Bacteroidota bacterium]